MRLTYIMIAWRNLTKDGSYSVINLIGLSKLFGITGISNASTPKGNRNPENNGSKFGKSFTTILHGFYQIELDSTNQCYSRVLVGNAILVRRFLKPMIINFGLFLIAAILALSLALVSIRLQTWVHFSTNPIKTV